MNTGREYAHVHVNIRCAISLGFCYEGITHSAKVHNVRLTQTLSVNNVRPYWSKTHLETLNYTTASKTLTYECVLLPAEIDVKVILRFH